MNLQRTTRAIISLSFVLLILICVMAGCGGSNNNKGNGKAPDVPTNVPADDPTSPYTGVPFAMIRVPGAARMPVDLSDVVRYMDIPNYPYYLSETEVTYELWKGVYEWAQQNGYSICDSGVDGTNVNDVQHPVTSISWPSAIVWCNALTEYYNAKNGSAPDLDCVYYTDDTYTKPLRISKKDPVPNPLVSGEQDQPYIKATAPGNITMTKCMAKGFRLPTTYEWELAARYIGPGQPTIEPLKSKAILTDGLYWTPGTYASGATDDFTNDEATKAVAWYGKNSNNTTHPVKQKSPNALGLYDMSGNVGEWCSDWAYDLTGDARVVLGGRYASSNFTNDWDIVVLELEIGYTQSSVGPRYLSSTFGLRIARTQ